MVTLKSVFMSKGSPNILIVEGNAKHRALIEEKFRSTFSNLSLKHAGDIAQATPLLEKHDWDLVIVNWQLADGTALELIQKLAAVRPEAAVAVLTEEAGAIDIDVPAHHGAIEFFMKDRRTLEYFSQRAQRLIEANERLLSLFHQKTNTGSGASDPGKSFQDPLTHVYNRSYFDHTLARELSLANRHRYEFAMLLVDIDGFPQLAAQKGRAFAEDCLKKLASALSRATRSGDIVARYNENAKPASSQEQFVALLHQCRKSDAVRCANRIFKLLKEQSQDKAGQELFTVSIGILHYQGETKTLFPQDLIDDARRALLSAKSLGVSRYAFA